MDYYFILRENSDNPILDEYMIDIANTMEDIKIDLDAKDLKVNSRFTKFTLKFKLPEIMHGKGMKRTLKNLGVACDVITVAKVMGDAYQDYLRIINNLELIGSNIEILNILETDADDKDMREAATEIKEILNKDTDKMGIYIKDITIEMGKKAGVEVVHILIINGMKRICKRSSPYSFIISSTIWLMDIYTGYSDVAITALKTYEVGYIPEKIANAFYRLDNDYSSYGSGRYIYYDNKDEAEKLYVDIISMRIFAEEEMILLEESGTEQLNLIGDFYRLGAGKNRKEIIADCKEMIEKLKKIEDKVR